MSEYRIDTVDQSDPDRPLHVDFFEARTDEAAVRKARRIVARNVTDPECQYGDLWMRDPDGGTSAEYVETIEVAA